MPSRPCLLIWQCYVPWFTSLQDHQVLEEKVKNTNAILSLFFWLLPLPDENYSVGSGLEVVMDRKVDKLKTRKPYIFSVSSIQMCGRTSFWSFHRWRLLWEGYGSTFHLKLSIGVFSSNSSCCYLCEIMVIKKNNNNLKKKTTKQTCLGNPKALTYSNSKLLCRHRLMCIWQTVQSVALLCQEGENCPWFCGLGDPTRRVLLRIGLC